MSFTSWWTVPKNIPYAKSYPSVIMHALLAWAIESMIGLIPLVAHWISHKALRNKQVMLFCDQNGQHLPILDLSRCTIMPETPYAEICILAVVTSGLSIYNFCHYINNETEKLSTSLTIVMMGFSVFFLLLGGILYALHSSGLAEYPDDTTYYILAGAIFSSGGLVIERSLLREGWSRRERMKTATELTA